MNWPTTIVFSLFHVGAVAALFMFSWRVFFATVFFIGCVPGWASAWATTACTPTALTRSPLGLEYFFALCGALTLEGGPIFWVATHRIHHQKSDQPGDPALPPRRRLLGPRRLDFVRRSQSRQYPHDVQIRARSGQASFYVWLNNYHWIPQVVLGLALLAIGGWPLMFWGIFVRVVFGLHATWLVNSATHMWGIAPLRDPRRFAQQLVGRADDLRRRLAQ